MHPFCRCAAVVVAVCAVTAGQDAQSGDAKQRARFARDIGKSSGSESIPQLVPLLSDPDREVRLETVKSLISIGTQHSIDPLITATRDNDPEIQVRATDGIVNFYLPGYVESSVLQRFGSAVRSRFEREDARAIDPYVLVRDEAVAAIAALVRGGNGMDVRANAARAAGILRGRAAVPSLVQALHTKDDDVMFESLLALQKIRDQSAGPEVVFLLRDLEPRVQIAAIETAALLRATQAVPELQRVYREARSDKVRKAALTALAMLPDESSRPLFQEGFTDRKEELRAAAAEGFGRLKNPQDVPAIRQAFEQERKAPARLAQAFALVALGQLETTEFAPVTTLVNALNSSRYDGIAEPYLVELAREPGVREVLYGYLRQGTRGEKSGIARILGRSGDKGSLPHLQALSKDPDVEVAQEAIRAIKNLQTRL
jgi:HEAT repeat protein